MVRVVTGVFLLVTAGVVLFVAPAWVVPLVMATVIGVATAEGCGLLTRAGMDGPSRTTTLLAVLLALSTAGRLGPLDPLAILALGGVAISAVALVRREEPATILEAIGGGAIALLAIALPMALVIPLYNLPGGRDLLVLLIVVIVLNDTLAFYVGSNLGRTAMAPVLSPKKTWEGAVGGVGGALIGAIVLSLFFLSDLPLLHAVVLGILLSVAGIGGDLAESSLKRAAGAKDSSQLLPGHGGALDRLDSLLFAVPVLYYYVVGVMKVS